MLVVQAESVALLDHQLSQLVVAAMLLSMLAAPFLIQASDRLALRWSSTEWMLRSLALHRVAAESLATVLELTGFEARAANDGLAAVGLALDFRPESK